jgi:hypothetical protein
MYVALAAEALDEGLDDPLRDRIAASSSQLTLNIGCEPGQVTVRQG